MAREGRREATERAAREEVCPLERAAGVFRYDLKAAFECVIVGIGDVEAEDRGAGPLQGVPRFLVGVARPAPALAETIGSINEGR